MGIFDRLKKTGTSSFNVSDDAVVAMADGNMIDVSGVSDPVFAQQVMGKTAAFRYDGDEVTICSPANGTVAALFPTGHAFGIQMKDGTELLVHIGIDTVNANGKGFKASKVKQGDRVKAGTPIVTVNLKELGKSYDMSTMLIVTKQGSHPIQFLPPQAVKAGQSVIA